MGRTSFTPITVFTLKEIANAPTITMPVAIINALPAYTAVLRSVFEMADTSSPTLGESSVDGSLIRADSDETELRVRPMCATVALLIWRGGGADDSCNASRNAVLRRLIKRTRGIASAVVVPTNCVLLILKSK
jgi:hypothetical protein